MDELAAKVFWRESLYPEALEGNYADLMFGELASYLNISAKEIRSIGQRSQQILNDEWNEKQSNCSKEFYKSNTTYLYNLTHWHANYGESYARVKALEFFKNKKVNKILDYGSGIGSTSILFSRNGFDVSAADVAQNLLSYLDFRIKERDLKCNCIDLNKDKLPINCYDAVTAIDVLEHVDDPRSVLLNIFDSLKEGGYICFNVCGSEGAPMHVSEAEQVLRHMNIIGFKRINDHGVPLFIYQKLNLHNKYWYSGIGSYIYFNIRFISRRALTKLGIYTKIKKIIKSITEK